MKGRNNTHGVETAGATVSYEPRLWQMADALRGPLDAVGYKHVALGLIFLKYTSDALKEHREPLLRGSCAEPEDPDGYRAADLFRVRHEASWPRHRGGPLVRLNAAIGQLVDDAMAAIERNNPGLNTVLPQEYARPALDKSCLSQPIHLMNNMQVDDDARGKNLLGCVHKCFLWQFASAEGREAGEFYTPRCVVQLLVEMIEPYRGRVYDPCCGWGGMFVQSQKFVQAHPSGNAKADISIFGQESNYTTSRLARMNLASRDMYGQIEQSTTLHSDRFPDLKADFILASLSLKVKDWCGERPREDKHWKLGVTPVRNVNFAWVQHRIHSLAPKRIFAAMAHDSTEGTDYE